MKIFVAHHAENIPGLVLLHNQFLLEAHELLVNVNSVAVQWGFSSGAKELADATASSWRFTDDGIAPYEFMHAASELSPDDHHLHSFVQELSTVLKKWNLADVLGICSLAGRSIDEPSNMSPLAGVQTSRFLST